MINRYEVLVHFRLAKSWVLTRIFFQVRALCVFPFMFEADRQ